MQNQTDIYEFFPHCEGQQYRLQMTQNAIAVSLLILRRKQSVYATMVTDGDLLDHNHDDSHDEDNDANDGNNCDDIRYSPVPQQEVK